MRASAGKLCCAEHHSVTPTTGRWWYFGDAMLPVPHDPVNDEINPCDGGVTPAGSGCTSS